MSTPIIILAIIELREESIVPQFDRGPCPFLDLKMLS